MAFKLLTFFFCFFVTSMMSAQETMIKKSSATSGYYIVTYKNYDVNLEISVNGYIVKDGSSNEDSSGQADVNFWIMPGKNVLSYRITERKPSKKKSVLPQDPKAEINFIVGQQGQFPDEGERLLSISWPKEASALGEWKNISFEPSFLPPSKLWSIAQPIEWSPELETSAIQFLESFTKALNSKDVNQVLPFLAFREKDTSEARYYPSNPEDDKKALASMMKSIGPNWKLNKKIKSTLLCDKKIVQLTDEKGQPVLNGKKDAAIPIYLSLVDKKWMIVR